MASLYTNKGIWYLSVKCNGKRKSISLKTKDKNTAKRLKPYAESQLIAELMGYGKPKLDLPFPKLVEKYLNTNHNWSKNTITLYTRVLKEYMAGMPLPDNITSQAIHRRVINTCWNWGIKNNLVINHKKLVGDTKGLSRHRTYSKDEMSIMFNKIKPIEFNLFVQFAYYTGARSGEIRSISRDNVFAKSLVVHGKTGQRIIKLNSQAQDIIHNQEVLWNYTRDYVSHKFKKEVRRLGIRNARFHDLRRTFGLSLIKQGMSIYKVSKLLGHKSVRTTEQHYAPLLTVEIEDFIL